MFSRAQGPAQLLMRAQLICLALYPGWIARGEDTDKQGVKVSARIAMCLPLAVPVDATTKVTLRGWGLEGVKEIRTSNPQVTLKIIASGKATIPNKQDAKQIGDTQVELEVTVAKDVPAGEVELIVAEPDNKNPPHKLLLGSGKAVIAPVIAEQEPNDGFAQAQALQIPQIVDGRIDGDGNVDVISFELAASQTIVLEVLASRYGSNLDSILTLFDGRGNIIAVNDDVRDTTKTDSSATRDSKINVVLPAGKYWASVQDAHDRGGPAHPYRLTLTVGEKK